MTVGYLSWWTVAFRRQSTFGWGGNINAHHFWLISETWKGLGLGLGLGLFWVWFGLVWFDFWLGPAAGIPAGSEGQQPTQWLKYSMLWELLTLGQGGSLTAPGGQPG